MNMKEILAFAPESKQCPNSFRVVTNRHDGTTYLEIYECVGTTLGNHARWGHGKGFVAGIFD